MATLLAALSVCVLLYSLYIVVHAVTFIWIWHKQSKQSTDDWLVRQRTLPQVAVVIPARNEAANMGRVLRALMDQTYPDPAFRIVVVDDHSTDGTAAIVAATMEAFPSRIQLLRLSGPLTVSQKKRAITLGVEAARDADIILTLDADCLPGPNWIMRMVGCFQPGVALVAGPIRKYALDRTPLEQIQCVESAGMIALAAGAIGLRTPMMANGGNLGFRRAAFEQVAGYRGIDHIASGDDELLMHKMHHAFRGLQPLPPVAYCLHTEAIVDTPALPDWASLRAQRIRWVSKSRAYHNPRMTLAQVNAYLANVTLTAAFAGAVFLPSIGWSWFALLFGLKLLAETAILLPALSFLGQHQLAWWIPISQPLHILYVLWVGLAGNLAKQYEWKGRVVR